MSSLEHKEYDNLRNQENIPQICQLPWLSRKIIKAFGRTNVQLHDYLSLQVYTHISIQVCAHVRGYRSSEYLCM